MVGKQCLILAFKWKARIAFSILIFLTFETPISLASSCAQLFEARSETRNRKPRFEEIYRDPRLHEIILLIAGRYPEPLRGEIVDELNSSWLFELYIKWIPDQGSFLALLRTSGRNKAASMARRRFTERREESPQSEGIEEFWFRDGRSARVLDRVSANEQLKRLFSEIAALELPTQNIAILSLGRTTDQRALSNLLDLPFGTLKSRLTRHVRPLLREIESETHRSEPLQVEESAVVEAVRKFHFANEVTILSILTFRKALDRQREQGEEEVRALISRYPEAARNTVAFQEIFFKHRPVDNVVKEMGSWEVDFLFENLPAGTMKEWKGKRYPNGSDFLDDPAVLPPEEWLEAA